MDTSLDNANNPFTNSNGDNNIIPQKSEGLLLNLSENYKQNGDEISPSEEFYRSEKSNGKRLASEFDDEEDLGPETDVDALDDVLSPSIAAAKALADGIVNNNPDGSFNPFVEQHEVEKAALEIDLDLQKQQSSEFDGQRSPREETPTPPADAVHDVVLEDTLAADSGEESEDEWNYIKGEVANKENISPQEADLLQDPDNMSQLNPNAAEFVPVSPTRSIPSPACRLLINDAVLSQSPNKPGEIDISLPNPQEFEKEVKSRPSDFDSCSSNGHDDNQEEQSKSTTQEIMENLVNGKNFEEIPEFHPTLSPVKQPGEEFHFGPNAAPFTPAKLLDQSEAVSTKAIYGDDTTTSVFDSTFETSRDNVDFPKTEDPMSASIYQESGGAGDVDPFDLNKVQVLPENLEEFLSKSDDTILQPFNETISDLPEHDPSEGFTDNLVTLDNDERIQTTDLDRIVDSEKELASPVSTEEDLLSSEVCELPKTPVEQEILECGLPDICVRPVSKSPELLEPVCVRPDSRSPQSEIEESKSPEPELQELVCARPQPEESKSPEPELLHKSPEPELLHKSPEPELLHKSPEPAHQAYSPEPRILTPDEKEVIPETPEPVGSPEPQNISPELRVLSPELQVATPEPEAPSPAPALLPDEDKISSEILSPEPELPVLSPQVTEAELSPELQGLSSPEPPVLSPQPTGDVCALPLRVSEPEVHETPLEIKETPSDSPVQDVTSSVKDVASPVLSPISDQVVQEESSVIVEVRKEEFPVEEKLLETSDACPLVAPRAVVETEPAAVAEVQSFLEQTQVSETTSPLKSPEGDVCICPLPGQTREEITQEIKTENITPEFPEHTVITPTEDTPSAPSEEFPKEPEVKEETATVAAAAAVVATAAVAATAIGVAAATAPSNEKKPAATKARTSTTAKKPPTTTAHKTPVSAAKPKTPTTTPRTKTPTATARPPPKATATATGAIPKKPTSAPPKPRSTTTTTATKTEKKPLASNDTKPKTTTRPATAPPTRTITKTTTTTTATARPRPTTLSRNLATSKIGSSATTRNVTSATTSVTTIKRTSTAPKSPSVAAKSPSVAAKSPSVAAKSLSAASRTPTSPLKPRPTSAAAKPRVPLTKTVSKTPDTEKQIKDTTNKLVASTTRTSLSSTRKPFTTSTVKKTESKTTAGTTRTTLTKTTTVTKGAATKKPAEITRNVTKTKTTKIEKPMTNGVSTTVTEQITLVNNVVNEPQLVKDNSPIDNIDNKLLVDAD